MKTGRTRIALLVLALAAAPSCSNDDDESVATTAPASSAPTTDAAEPTTTEPAGTAAPVDDSATDVPPEARGLLVNLATDDTWSANMALGLATNAAGQGLDVIVFLNVRGVYLADAERMPATEGNSDQSIHEKITALVDTGAKVIVCPSCAMEAGLTQDDLIDGAVIGEPGGIIPTLADPDYNIISYTDPVED